MRHLVERHEPQPIAVRARARVGPCPVARAPDGHAAGGVPADVPVHVRVDEVLRGPGEEPHRFPELAPVAGPLQAGERGQLHRVVLERRPVEGVLAGTDRDQRPAAGDAHTWSTVRQDEESDPSRTRMGSWRTRTRSHPSAVR